MAIMPIFLFFVTASASRQEGSTTPNTGRSFSFRKVSREVEVTVPQAIRTAFRSKDRRKAMS